VARGFVSGLDAVGYARNIINKYKIRRILTGGVENLSIEAYTVFYKLGWLRKGRNQNINKSYRLFDTNNKGIIFGEGACVLVLEDLRYVDRKKANILSEVIGYGFTFGDSKEMIARSMHLALEDAGLEPGDIDYICANSNGSKKDIEELEAIREIFPGSKMPVVSSIKFSVGESLGAVCAMQVASTSLSISKGLIPPTVNFKNSNNKFQDMAISNCTIKRKIGAAMVNSFGLDGNNTCIILKKVAV
ncbi:MAG: beta-ketoacyl synthase N-terminal-like domain-containing protein, partial [Candidatus Omnitrophota bacterium]